MAQLTTNWQRISTIGITYGEIRTYAKYSSQSMANNTTTYQVRMVYYTYQANGVNFSSATATLDGTQKGYGYTNMPYGETIILDINRTITHNANGSSPTKNIATSWSASFGGGGSTSANITFPTIKRFATITNSPASLTDEDTPWFSYSNPANGTMSCWLEVNPTGDHLAIRTLSGASGTFTWDLTEEERNELRSKMPNASTGKIRIGLYTTINGTTGSNYVDKTFTIINANPVFSDFTFEDINTTTLALTGNNQDIIKGYSKVRATITATNKAVAQKGASMVKYRLSIGESSVDIAYNDSADVSSMISNVTTGTINVYAVDSRNNSTMVTKLANREINYEAVYTNINNSSFQRDDNRVGDNGVLTLSGTFWNDDFGDETNSLTVSYRLKKSDSSTWINGTTSIVPTVSQNTFSFSGMIASDNQDTTWDLQSSYDLEITISDELTTSITTYVLASAVPTLSLDKEGVGIMCQYDTSLGGGLQVNGVPVKGYNPEDYVVAEYTVSNATTNKITLTDLGLEKDKTYCYKIVGSATADSDIRVQMNDIASGYYMYGTYKTSSATSSSEVSLNSSYRPNNQYFYYSFHMKQYYSIIEGKINIYKNLQQNKYYPSMTWRTYSLWSGSQQMGDVFGVLGTEVQQINKMTFTLASGYFRNGTVQKYK